MRIVWIQPEELLRRIWVWKGEHYIKDKLTV